MSLSILCFSDLSHMLLDLSRDLSRFLWHMYIGSMMYVIHMCLECFHAVIVITLAYHNVCIIVCKHVDTIIYLVIMSQALLHYDTVSQHHW